MLMMTSPLKHRLDENSAEHRTKHATSSAKKTGPLQAPPLQKQRRQSGKYKKVCVTDPDATMATNARNRRLEPSYKQHTAVDDKLGVILDVEVTTGERNEGDMIEPQVDAVRATSGKDVTTVTADAGYAYAKAYGALERRHIDPLIPAKGRSYAGKLTGR